MNTAPQMIIALLRQLVGAVGVKQADITVCDTLAYLVHEYYDILHEEFPDGALRGLRGQVRPHQGQGRRRCRSTGVAGREGKTPDYLPTCFAEAEYLVNFANLKAHTGTGVTLCGKNHFGSLVRWPVQQGYYDMHPNCFSKETKIYREQVDLMGHAHLGGKTVLYLIDGLFSGMHPIDPAPRRMDLAAVQRPLDLEPAWPRRTRWPSTRWASISSGPSGRLPAPGAASTTTCTKPPWPATRPRAPSTTRTMPRRANGWRASASTSTGTTPTRRSTRAIWEPARGSNWSPRRCRVAKA